MISSMSDSRPEKPPVNNLERPGFPTYAQYKQVENSYLQSLTPRRQGKALISQAMFDRIWDVLHQPDSHNETAQFRFWARKMFTVSKTHRVTLGAVDNSGEETAQEVLLHDNLLVAIQEQLYDLLCYCHGSTGHGGRDKTCALIRKHYTWVPKDLVSNFIKACPTCIMKKCGNSESAAVIAQMSDSTRNEEPPLPLMRDFFHGSIYGQDPVPASSSIPGLPWPTTGPRDPMPMSPVMLEEDPLEAAYRDAILRSRGLRSIPGINGQSPRGIHGLPMSREVSLYKGIPNGWQFRHGDYASAHAEFMRTKDLPSVEETEHDMAMRRPRIPSIAPLWGPDQFPHPEFGHIEEDALGYPEHLPVLEPLPVSPNHHQEDHNPAMTMHYLLMAAESQREDIQDHSHSHAYMPQIDPSLMASCSGAHSPSAPQEQTDMFSSMNRSEDHDASNLGLSANFSSSSSIKRAGAPLRLEIGFPSEKTFQALLAYRDSLGEGNMTPDSPITSNWHPGNPSPASSDSSSSGSQLSAFPMTDMESATTTPGSSALTTPVDECGSIAGSEGGSVPIKGVKGKGKCAQLSMSEEIALSDGIEVACGL